MGTRGGRWFGSAGCRAVCLLACLLLPVLAAAGDNFPADLVFRDGFEDVERFTTDIGAEPFRAPDSPVFEPGATRTLEAWIYLGSAVQRNCWIMGKGDPLPGGNVNLAFVLGIDGGAFWFATDTYGIRAPTPVPLRTWTHVAAVVDSSGARLYVNGVLVDSRAGVAPVRSAAGTRLGVGSPIGTNGEGIRGYETGVFARQLRFWSVARTQAQLQAGMLQSRPSDATGLVGNWPMDEAGGTVARDLSGFGRALTKSVAIGAARIAVLEAGPHFVETPVQMAAGLLTNASAITAIDFDNDGDLDLFLPQVFSPATYPATERRQLAFRNVGGTFVDATDAVLGDFKLVGPRREWVADFNADGRSDLLIAETGTDTFPYPGAQSRLLIQSTDGRLVDETATRLPLHDSYTHGLAVADIDGDGDLDVYMGNYIADVPRIYLNDGTGHFSDAPGRLPADVASGALQHPSVTFCDVNGDAHPDVLLGGNYYAPNGESSNVPNILLMNDGSGHFIHDPAFTLPPKLHGSAGVTVEIACADLNADGAPEVVMATDIGGEVPGLQLLLNDGAGHFTDASAQLNLAFPSTDRWIVQMAVADINGDGKPDLMLRTNTSVFYDKPFSRSILLNRGGAVFVDASETFTTNSTEGMVVGDFDRDGRLDVVRPDSNQSRLLLFRNARLIDLGLFGN